MNAEIEGQDIVAPQAEVIPTVSASKRDAEELGVEVPEAKKAKTSVEGTKTAETAKEEDSIPSSGEPTDDSLPPVRHEGPNSLLSDHQKAQAAASTSAGDDQDENEEADLTVATEATEGDGSGDEDSDGDEVSEDELAALKADAEEAEPEEEEKPAAGRRSSRRTKEKLDYAALAKAQGLDGDDSD